MLVKSILIPKNCYHIVPNSYLEYSGSLVNGATSGKIHPGVAPLTKKPEDWVRDWTSARLFKADFQHPRDSLKTKRFWWRDIGTRYLSLGLWKASSVVGVIRAFFEMKSHQFEKDYSKSWARRMKSRCHVIIFDRLYCWIDDGILYLAWIVRGIMIKWYQFFLLEWVMTLFGQKKWGVGGSSYGRKQNVVKVNNASVGYEVVTKVVVVMAEEC